LSFGQAYDGELHMQQSCWTQLRLNMLAQTNCFVGWAGRASVSPRGESPKQRPWKVCRSQRGPCYWCRNRLLQSMWGLRMPAPSLPSCLRIEVKDPIVWRMQKNTPEFAPALQEHGLTAFWGGDASSQAGHLSEVLLQESKSGQSNTKQGEAEQGRAEQSEAKQSKAEESNAKQTAGRKSEAEQSKGR